MFNRSLKILQVNTEDIGGGAEKVAWMLHQNYLIKKQASCLAVGRKQSECSDIVQIENSNRYRHLWAQFWYNIGETICSIDPKNRVITKLYGLAKAIGQPNYWLDRQLGYENFDFPSTAYLLDLPQKKPDILHCHNLHGEYFDLQKLPLLSRQISFIITLHDAWLLTGHCAHSFDCDRWQIGCGKCPDLNIYPPIKRDTTAYNWQRKRKIFANSKLYIATPSQWLMNKVKESILAPAIIESRVIPNGIDLSVFKPGNQKEIRTKLNFPLEAKIILFTANGIRENPWKDYKTMRKAIVLLAENLPSQNILFLALGENSPPEKIGNATIHFIPYEKDSQVVADYYRVSDVYVHAAKAETFGLAVTEALACGIPVVATNVGGIPEQIEQGKTGFLVSIGDSIAMTQYIQLLLEDDEFRQQIGWQASVIAQHKFSLELMTNNYLNWYQEIMDSGRNSHY